MKNRETKTVTKICMFIEKMKNKKRKIESLSTELYKFQI